MERVVNKAKSHKEARDWDIRQAQSMSADERQEIAKSLKLRVYGENTQDVRSSHK